MNLKSDIKVLNIQQVDYKNQRKTVNRVGPKTMEPWQASMKHASNRNLLRHMYIVLGEHRGKSIEQIENKSHNPPDEKILENLRKKYEQPIKTQETLNNPAEQGTDVPVV